MCVLVCGCGFVNATIECDVIGFQRDARSRLFSRRYDRRAFGGSVRASSRFLSVRKTSMRLDFGKWQRGEKYVITMQRLSKKNVRGGVKIVRGHAR